MEKGTYQVLLTRRSQTKGKAAIANLQAKGHPGAIELIVMDVTDDSTIEAAVKHVETTYGKLDVLVNNAAIAGPETPLRERMQAAFNANATGPAVVTEAFYPLLKKATTPAARIINVGNGGRMVARRLEPSAIGADIKHVPYRTSKCALQMVTACQVVEYKDDDIKVFMYSPGFTASNLRPGNTLEMGARPAADVVRPMVDIVEGKKDEYAGKNLGIDGTVLPW